MALLRAISALDDVKAKGDEKIGVDIIRRALEEPIRQIAENSGEEGSVIAQRIKAEKGNKGFNAQTGKDEDLVNAGVIDPTKVTRTALQNASSIAALMLTTECVISEIPEKEKPAPAMPPGGGMGGMGGGMY